MLNLVLLYAGDGCGAGFDVLDSEPVISIYEDGREYKSFTFDEFEVYVVWEKQGYEEPESLMPWAPYIQQNFGMKNSGAYTNTYLN